MHRLTGSSASAIIPRMAPQSREHPADGWHTFDAVVGGERIHVVTRPGFPGWDGFGAPNELLADAVEVVPGSRILLLGAGHGALGAYLVRRAAAQMMLGDIWEPALAAARRTLVANGVAATVHDALDLPGTAAGSFDIVTLVVPPSRGLARMWLRAARDALRPGGRLYLAGHNDEGIRPVIDDAAALFGSATLLAYRRRCRVALASKTEANGDPDWAHLPGIAPGTWQTFSVETGGERYDIRSLPGIFSYDRLDDGTRLLLETMPDPAGARVLDAGCGYGLLGLVAARRGARRVDMLDASTLAVAAARANVTAAGLQRVEVLLSDGLAAVAGRVYDMALSNPPFHAGKTIDDRVARGFIANTYNLLAPDGRLVLVANRFLPYEAAIRVRYGHVETLAVSRGYHVLSALKSRA